MQHYDRRVESLGELLSEERTLLSKERTSLSYIRTGVTLIALGLGAIKFFETDIPVSLLGTFMIIVGILLIVYHAMWDRRYIHRIQYLEDRIHNSLVDDKITDKYCK